MAKLCKECGKKMILGLPVDGFISQDTYPPMYPYEWGCANGHTEDAGYMTEDDARKLEEEAAKR